MPTIRVDLKTRETVRQLAAEMGITMTEVMRLAARIYKEERERREAREQARAQRNVSGSAGGEEGEETSRHLVT